MSPFNTMTQYNKQLLYPAVCEVCYMPDDTYVYPIFKNASSSIRDTSTRSIVNAQINRHAGTVIVYWREAKQRYRTGVTTYLQHNRHLDENTIKVLINNGEIVNRHFMPQYMWLCHLALYYDGDIILKDFREVNTDTHKNITKHKKTINVDTDWNCIDNLIFHKFKNKVCKFTDIQEYLKQEHKVLWKNYIAQD